MNYKAGICGEDQFLVEGLKTRWDPFIYYFEKIGKFFSNPLSEKKMNIMQNIR